MGCFSGLLCPKKKSIEITGEQITTNPYELLTTTENENINRDLKEKRELAEYLIKNDINIYNRLLKIVQDLDDEQFNQMFEGNTDYPNYDIPSDQKKFFLQLVAKFEHNKDLVFNYYNQKKYYSFILQIWKANILYSLKKNNGNSEEQEKILRNARINMDDWDNEFRSFFNSIIQENPTEEAAKAIQYFFKRDLPELDDLVKLSEKCKKDVEKNEKSACSKFLQCNIENQNKEYLKNFVTNFFEKNKEEIINIDSDIENVAKNDAIKKLMNSGITRTKCNEIVNAIIKKYKDSSFSGTIETSTEFENIENVALKINQGLLDPGWRKRMKAMVGNETIKRAVVSITILNVSYSIIDIAKKIANYQSFQKQILIRFEEIKRNFDKHKGKVQILPDDIDKAAELIQEVYLEFTKDRDDIIQLIDDIDSALNNKQTERNKSIFGLISSTVKAGSSIFLAATSKGEKRVDLCKDSIAEILSMAENGADIISNQIMISDLKKKLKKAKDLQTKIEQAMRELKEKYEQLKVAHINF